MDQSTSIRDAPEKHQLLASSSVLKPGTDGVLVHNVPCSDATSQSSARRATEGSLVLRPLCVSLTRLQELNGHRLQLDGTS